MQRHGNVASLLTIAFTLQRFGPYEIIYDPDRVYVEVIHAFLYGESDLLKGEFRV